MDKKTFQNYKPKTEKEKNLAQAFTHVKNEQEALNFLRDLLTPAELEEFSNRFEIAKLLETKKLSYAEIAKKVGTSTTTVTRVALWLNSGCGGYKTVLERFSKENKK